MPDGSGQPQLDCAGELRRIIAGRRRVRRRLAIAALVGCALVPLGASILWKPPVLMVWNASASALIGLYGLRPGVPVRRGDLVIAWMPGPARELAAQRRYIPANVPLVKRVAAVAGDRICAHGVGIWVNGRRVAMRRRLDLAARPLPWWKGCRRLRGGDHLLLNDSRFSFDGRYFGVTGSRDILGRAELLWAKPAKGSSDG